MIATFRASIIAPRGGAILVREITGDQFTVAPTAAPLVFLPRAAGARLVPPDLRSIAPWLARVSSGLDLPTRFRMQEQEEDLDMNVKFKCVLF
jgi:hypothetical protein